jgi:hypothetical protein
MFSWSNGETYEGNWRKGVKDGHGIWKSPKGDFYDGLWENNRENGKGIFKHRNSFYKG